jgi:hypothetical protein
MKQPKLKEMSLAMTRLLQVWRVMTNKKRTRFVRLNAFVKPAQRVSQSAGLSQLTNQ